MVSRETLTYCETHNRRTEPLLPVVVGRPCGCRPSTAPTRQSTPSGLDSATTVTVGVAVSIVSARSRS